MATYAQTRNAVQFSSLSDQIRKHVLAMLPTGVSKRAIRVRDGIARYVSGRRDTGYREPPRNLAARMAQHTWDEHGGIPRDVNVCGMDYVAPGAAREAPFFDHGGAGLAVVSLSRTTEYRGAYKGWTSTCSEAYLVGRNEVGTWFAHRIRADIQTVREALDWMWDGHADQIVRRQGDIAIIRCAGPKGLSRLPGGHTVDDATGTITHRTHPSIACPGTGERVIVARRAKQKGNGAGFGTRD